MHSLISILILAAVGYLVMCAMVYFRQPHYVYVPDRTVDMTPSDIGIDFEDVRLAVGEGETVAGWFVAAKEGGADLPVVLMLHGNGGDIANRMGYVSTLHENGFDGLFIDYRGYGESTGEPTEQNTYEDALAAWRYLTETRGIAPERVIVLGRSLGGAVASWLATEVNPRGVVMESAFASAPAMAGVMFPFLPVRWCCSFKYDSLARMPSITCPVLVAHGPDDSMVPFEQGRQLFDAANEPKRFVELRGGHNESGLDVNDEYLGAFKAFFGESGEGEIQ